MLEGWDSHSTSDIEIRIIHCKHEMHNNLYYCIMCKSQISAHKIVRKFQQSEDRYQRELPRPDLMISAETWPQTILINEKNCLSKTCHHSLRNSLLRHCALQSIFPKLQKWFSKANHTADCMNETKKVQTMFDNPAKICLELGESWLFLMPTSCPSQ